MSLETLAACKQVDLTCHFCEHSYKYVHPNFKNYFFNKTLNASFITILVPSPTCLKIYNIQENLFGVYGQDAISKFFLLLLDILQLNYGSRIFFTHLCQSLALNE